jgi:hypothetical protein
LEDRKAGNQLVNLPKNVFKAVFTSSGRKYWYQWVITPGRSTGLVRKSNSNTHRATFETWLGRFFLPFLFLGLLVVTLVNVAELSPALGGLCLLGLLLTGLFEYAVPMMLNWLKIESSGVTGSINGRRFHIFWAEVLAVWRIKRGRHPFLCLGTSQGTAVIPLRFLDAEAVWNETREYAPPSALESSAFQRLPDYREWAAVRNSLISSDHPPRQVIDHWIVQMVGWGSLLFFISTSISLWSAGNPEMVLVFVPLILLSIVTIANWGITEFDSEGVRRRTLTGTWHIRWDELEQVEIDPLETSLVLEGQSKRLMVSGPSMWIQSGRKDALSLLQAQCEHRRIPIRHSLVAMFKYSRNSRVKSS